MRLFQLSGAISRRLVVIAANDTARSAAQILSRPEIGLLVVGGGDGRMIGVLSRADLVRHFAGARAHDVPVSAFMTRDVARCLVEDDLHEIWERMAERRLRNLPVLDARARPVGVLDMRDALAALLEAEEVQVRQLAAYISGSYAA